MITVKNTSIKRALWAFPLLLIFWLISTARAVEPAAHVSSATDEKAQKLVKKVSALEDKIDLDYAEKKKQEILTKYPTLETDYLNFVRSKYPTLETEIIEIFKKYPKPLKQYGTRNDTGKTKVTFELIEKMCMADGKCSDELGDLLSKKYPNFAKDSAAYVLDNKPELVAELIIATIEILAADGKITSSTTTARIAE